MFYVTCSNKYDVYVTCSSVDRVVRYGGQRRVEPGNIGRSWRF